jgi:hypothetical protein
MESGGSQPSRRDSGSGEENALFQQKRQPTHMFLFSPEFLSSRGDVSFQKRTEGNSDYIPINPWIKW